MWGSLSEVQVGEYALADLDACLTEGRAQRLREVALRWRTVLPTVWHVNSTASGGGVAAMLYPLLGYSHALGLDVRWLVISADPGFFHVTKRIDNGISGVAGDGGALGADEAAVFSKASAAAAADLGGYIRRGDIVVLHDPQTAGLIEHVSDLGAIAVWRAHNGADRPNPHTVASRQFLAPYLRDSQAIVTTRPHFLELAAGSVRASAAITPFIDPASPKNVGLDASEVLEELHRWDIVAASGSPSAPIAGHVVIREGAAPSPQTPMVVQVSRWDAVKDMIGVMNSFAAGVPDSDAFLTLVGPQVDGVADDPEASEYFDSCLRHWQQLPDPVRARMGLYCLPTADAGANARAVNAIQRHATVITQKSRSEGFGLTVTEAMWKARPVLATAVGGVAAQLRDHETGRLTPATHTPGHPDAFGEAMAQLLADPVTRTLLGARAREQVRTHYLPDTHIAAELDLFTTLVDRRVLA